MQVQYLFISEMTFFCADIYSSVKQFHINSDHYHTIFGGIITPSENHRHTSSNTISVATITYMVRSHPTQIEVITVTYTVEPHSMTTTVTYISLVNFEVGGNAEEFTALGGNLGGLLAQGLVGMVLE